MKYLLDTNICIYIIKKKPSAVIKHLINKDFKDVAVSSITLSELEYGVQKSSSPLKNKVALAEFLAPFKIISFDDNAAQQYGLIRADLEKKGSIIGAMDLLIAAQALSQNLILVTNNEKEFNRIKRLKIENWVN